MPISSIQSIFNNYSTRARWIWYELAIIISYSTSASEMIVLLKTPTKSRWISPTRTNRYSHVTRLSKLSTRERTRLLKKTWQIMWRKIIFKWQPSKLLWIWIFGAVIKARTTEKNYYLGRLLWSCLKPQAGFAEREKKLYCRLDCSSEWLHSLYV